MNSPYKKILIRERIEVPVELKVAFSLKTHFFVIIVVKLIVSKHFEYEASCQLPQLLFVTHIYTKDILAYEQYYIGKSHTKYK